MAAGIDKAGVRRVARTLGLTDLAELPAAPCLASRVETGIPIDPDSLMRVNRIERELADVLDSTVARCRVRHDGIAIELDEAALRTLTDADRSQIDLLVRDAWPEQPVSLTHYRRGSAFLRAPGEGEGAPAGTSLRSSAAEEQQ